MIVRLPTSQFGLEAQSSWHSPLEVEIAGEKASALAHASRLAEIALKTLQDFDENEQQLSPATRNQLVYEASQRVWNLLVQREILGLYSHAELRSLLAVPGEVWSRMGALTQPEPKTGLDI